jgi:hypothetical protein
MKLTYIWVEGEANLGNFCRRRFPGEQLHWVESIGHIGEAVVEMVYKQHGDGFHKMFLLYMEIDKGEIFPSELNQIRRMSYEQIRADKHSILHARG